MLWDAAKGDKNHSWKTSPNTRLDLHFRPRSKQLLAVGTRRFDRYHWSVDVWDTRSGKSAHSLRGPHEIIRTAAISPDGKYMLTGGVAGRVGLWDMKKGGKVAELKGHSETTKGIAAILFVQATSSTVNEISQVTFSPDGRSASQQTSTARPSCGT